MLVEAERVLRMHMSLVSQEAANALVFEHGMADGENGGGCGISHAHLHILGVPPHLELGLLPEPDDLFTWTEIPESLCLPRRQPDIGYLLVGYQGVFQSRPTPFVESQYLRRWIAALLGLDQWDWRTSGDSLPLASQIAALQSVHALPSLDPAASTDEH